MFLRAAIVPSRARVAVTAASVAAVAVSIAVVPATTFVTIPILAALLTFIGTLGAPVRLGLLNALGRLWSGLGRRWIGLSMRDAGLGCALKQRHGGDGDQRVVEKSNGAKDAFGKDVKWAHHVDDHDENADNGTLFYEGGQSVGKAAKFL